MALKIGDKAPEILGTDQHGNTVELNHFRGKKLVLYFYPKDHTPGCTTQACNLRDNMAALKSKDYEVVGVSTDSQASHRRFIEKQNLPFSLIADEQRRLAEQFGTWGEKSLYGKTYMGMLRTTFIIDEHGIIERIITPKEVKTKSHAEQILG